METKTSGNTGEVLAENFLKKKGYLVLERNFSTKIGEIDLICRDKDYIVFVEVKTRDASTLISPKEAVTPAKQSKIKKTALAYLSAIEKEMNVRYDVIEVMVYQTGIKKVKIHHIPGAFI